MSHFNRKHSLERLDYYYQVINTTVLSKQSAASGLIPASVAITSHGDYTDAWVRDNVYSIYCVYGLALAYRRLDDISGRTWMTGLREYKNTGIQEHRNTEIRIPTNMGHPLFSSLLLLVELEHAVVKLMRGLLFSMMRQAPKVEKFKKTQDTLDALHAKYKTDTGATVIKDNEWGHLQIDATSFFVLALADMTTSGLNIIFTQDEVDFVQNLVFYIERAYRTPDFGIWERGNKSNHGQPELNTSSIGMAVAALRAINGVNLFGARGGPSSTIYVLPDELTRNATTLQSVLPRESNSKEIDGSVLSVIGFPAFACTDPALVKRTREEAKMKLEGKYGWKRFLRDGHQTEIEDTSRLHYNDNELKAFEDIESEWPLFFTYMVMEGLFTGDMEQVEEYRKKLEPTIIDSAYWDPNNKMFNEDREMYIEDTKQGLHIPLLPELYYVPANAIEAEKANPHSQRRLPNDNTPLVWALSLYLLGSMIYENLLSPSEVDPLGRRFNVNGQKRETITQIVLLSENAELQNKLAMYGLETQAVDQISTSITVLPPKALADVYYALGQNTKLGLTGRPKRPVGVLGTSRLYRIEGHIYAFTPHFMDSETFYLNSDPDFLISAFENELAFCSDNWFYAGRPTVVVVLSEAMLGNLRASPTPATNPTNPTAAGAGAGAVPNGLGHGFDTSRKNLLNFFMNLRSGDCNGVRVRLSRLSETLNTSNIESLDFLIDKPELDWESILLVNKSAHYGRSTHRKLGYNESKTQASTPGGFTPGTKTPKRRNTAFHGKSLGTPLDKLQDEGYFQDIATALSNLNVSNGEPRFRLKDHEESPVFPAARKAGSLETSSFGTDNDNGSGISSVTSSVTNSTLKSHHEFERCQSPVSETPPSATEMLALTLGDRSQFDQAVSSLASSMNLYDQIDLLQYMASCEHLDCYIGDLQASLKELLEEVYLKAVRLQYWSIARQATGLLHKVVPALTINITDLVIRQKQISIGSGQQEVLISTPVGPETLAKIFFEQCSDDVREGPVVQEIIIYLGSFIRTTPQMFDGIIRLRTHYIIIALREEISRMNNCDEEEAIEHLMQLSPYELQSLLGTILSGPTLCDNGSNIMIRDKPGGFLMLSRFTDHWRRPSLGSEQQSFIPIMPPTSEGQADPTKLVIRAQSAGYMAGNFARVEINGNAMFATSRGLHVWAIDRQQKIMLEHASFDTHISTEESEAFTKFIEWLQPGMLIIIASRDDFSEHLTVEAIKALEHLGSQCIRDIKYRDSYVLIAEKGGVSDKLTEAHRGAQEGPTPVVECTVYLEDQPETDGKVTQENIARFFPNASGRWLRRRKNDGALNRVPAYFFSQTWKVLDKSKGIQIFDHCLPRDPTVLEMTPKEYNFALAVEGFLGWFTDPAERQIAVEVLALIYHFQKRHPTIPTSDCTIDVPLIMKRAREIFWYKWVENNKSRFEKSELFAGGFHYEEHKDLVRKLFYDLPIEGTESTSVYLRKAIVETLPFKEDSIDIELKEDEE
ncbi:glycosyl hydrolases family 15-domain-containing protein [Spinellus fusiger]|nr:glycosyl hydrolases family 15-domain-containing protein [Spinellus fusiger]